MKRAVEVIKIRYIDFPWSSVSNYFNGDMFEDWLKSDEKNDPCYELKQWFRARDKALQHQAIKDFKAKL